MVDQADYTTRQTCRVCDSQNIRPLFSLGEQYVSDYILPEEIGIKGIKCPLDVIQCNNCSLVQLQHTARQDFLYSRHYWYRSGITQTMRNALKEITVAACRSVDLYPGDTVLDIGSNDGTLLRSYDYTGLTKVGVEPAKNLAVEGKIGVDVFINDFWNYEAYKEEGCTRAKIITAIGMFYDLENPNQFIADIAKSLHPEGVFIAQLMCLGNMINLCDIGNLAHEHLEFYSLASLEYLFDKHGLEIYDIETNQVNGQSYRVYARHIGSSVKARNPQAAATRIHNIRVAEDVFNSLRFFQVFFAKLEANRESVHNFISNAVINEKQRVWVYGASTKGNVLLQYYGLNELLIEAASDISVEKQGKVTIGTNIPIKSPHEFREANPDYALMLPYSFAEEFIKRESEWLKKGNHFIIPLPELRVI